MRVAVYFTPSADHPLVRAAAAWLGRDAFTGAAAMRGDVPGMGDGEADALTAEPCRYGFHATLKAPFAIAAGRDLDDLRNAAAGFAAAQAGTIVPALALSAIGSFFALAPERAASGVGGLAAAAVRAFEPFRAPLSPGETARRAPERLTPHQRENLATWGYPYVFDDFRFHMTLTGPVPAERRAAVHAVLAERFGAFLGRPLAIDRLALFVEPEPPGDFVVDSLFPLRGAPAGG